MLLVTPFLGRPHGASDLPLPSTGPKRARLFLALCAGRANPNPAMSTARVRKGACLAEGPGQSQPKHAAATPTPRIVLRTGSQPPSPGVPSEHAGS